MKPIQSQNINLQNNSIVNLQKGKLPPQALDLEEVVLGAMMIDKKGVDEVIDTFSNLRKAFYSEKHQLILIQYLSYFKIASQLIF